MPKDPFSGGRTVSRTSKGSDGPNVFELESELEHLAGELRSTKADIAKKIAAYCISTSTGDPATIRKIIGGTLKTVDIKGTDLDDILLQALALLTVNRK